MSLYSNSFLMYYLSALYNTLHRPTYLIESTERPPPWGTTYSKRQNFLIQSPIIRPSRKRPPRAGDRDHDHFLGWRFNFPLFQTSWKRLLDARGDLFVRCVYNATQRKRPVTIWNSHITWKLNAVCSLPKCRFVGTSPRDCLFVAEFSLATSRP